MYSIRKKFVNFWRISNYCLDHLSYIVRNRPDKREVFVYSSGVLNYLWQSWNGFWRVYWLTHCIGGLDVSNKRVVPLRASCGRREAVYYLCSQLSRRPPRGSFDEPTWGDIDILKRLAASIPNPGNSILDIFSIERLSRIPIHLQRVRNAAIHLDKDNMDVVRRCVVPHYAISQIRYPTDIIFANDLATGKAAIKNWIDHLCGFLQLV